MGATARKGDTRVPRGSKRLRDTRMNLQSQADAGCLPELLSGVEL